MSVPGPLLGPCVDWVTAEEVADCCGANIDDVGPTVFDQVAFEASSVLFEVSGRQFTGLCDRSVRPCSDPCSCWGPASTGLGPWAWSAAAWGYGGAPAAWANECGDRCGCGTLSRVKLSGYPVREITEVKIDGDVLPELDDDNNPNWRLDGWQWLVRMDSPGPPVAPRRWPACQNLALDDTESGTFSIAYRSGIDPPDIGRRAAAALACELYKQCGGQACALPTGATKVQRQGVTVERALLQSWLDPKKGTGILALDVFLHGYWGRRSRRPAVWSPDVQAHARRVGSA